MLLSLHNVIRQFKAKRNQAADAATRPTMVATYDKVLLSLHNIIRQFTVKRNQVAEAARAQIGAHREWRQKLYSIIERLYKYIRAILTQICQNMPTSENVKLALLIAMYKIKQVLWFYVEYLRATTADCTARIKAKITPVVSNIWTRVTTAVSKLRTSKPKPPQKANRTQSLLRFLCLKDRGGLNNCAAESPPKPWEKKQERKQIVIANETPLTTTLAIASVVATVGWLLYKSSMSTIFTYRRLVLSLINATKMQPDDVDMQFKPDLVRKAVILRTLQNMSYPIYLVPTFLIITGSFTTSLTIMGLMLLQPRSITTIVDTTLFADDYTNYQRHLELCKDQTGFNKFGAPEILLTTTFRDVLNVANSDPIVEGAIRATFLTQMLDPGVGAADTMISRTINAVGSAIRQEISTQPFGVQALDAIKNYPKYSQQKETLALKLYSIMKTVYPNIWVDLTKNEHWDLIDIKNVADRVARLPAGGSLTTHPAFLAYFNTLKYTLRPNFTAISNLITQWIKTNGIAYVPAVKRDLDLEFYLQAVETFDAQIGSPLSSMHSRDISDLDLVQAWKNRFAEKSKRNRAANMSQAAASATAMGLGNFLITGPNQPRPAAQGGPLDPTLIKDHTATVDSALINIISDLRDIEMEKRKAYFTTTVAPVVQTFCVGLYSRGSADFHYAKRQQDIYLQMGGKKV